MASSTSSLARYRRMGGMMRPSWTSSSATGIEPGAMPPMSAWCARLATKPIGSRPALGGSAKTGETMVTSGRCVPPRKGSLRMARSPGRQGARRSTARTDSGIAPRWTGICAAWARSWPCASKTAQEKSARSLMLGESEACRRVAPISSAMEATRESKIAMRAGSIAPGSLRGIRPSSKSARPTDGHRPASRARRAWWCPLGGSRRGRRCVH